MQVEVRLFAGLEARVPGASFGVPFPAQVSEGATLYTLLEVLSIPEQEAFTVLVNGRREQLNFSIKEGDRIGIFPPVGGG